MASLLAEGTIFAGDYRVRRPLSQGGMGAVYVVDQLSTGMPRALKLMRPELVSDPVLRERFAREARVGASIASEHVVAVLAAGVDAETSMPWLVMELLDGKDLASLVGREGPLTAARASVILEQLCHAIGAAHAAGVVHRDLKPENVFVAEARRAGATLTVKVLDFGIAKIIAEAKTSSTEAMGTPLWMAPEQTERGARIGPPTDVWAIGLIAFFILTGKSYWLSADDPSAGVSSLLREIVLDQMVPASQRAAALRCSGRLPGGFDAWFGRATARDPSARFPDATAAMRALAPLLQADASAATVPAAPWATPASSPPPAAPLAPATQPGAPGVVYRPVGEHGASAPPKPRPGKRTALAAAAASTVALLAVGLGARYLQRPDKACSYEPNDCLARCDDGSALSCRMLGEMYETGEHGAPKNPELAWGAYSKACDKRNREACAALSALMLEGRGGPTMVDRALEHAKAGCEGAVPIARACYVLGALHERGEGGLSRDLVKARSLYEQACKDRHGPACTRRGLLAAEGPDKNEREAEEYWDAACTLRDAEGCSKLGTALLPNAKATGKGVRAEEAFRIACEAGLARACAKAAVMRWPEWRRSEEWTTVARYLESGCGGAISDALACFKRGELFERGLGVARDAKRASELYASACHGVDAKDREGQAACAHARTRAARTMVDPTMAVRALEQACTDGDPWGCVELNARTEDPARRRELHDKACARVSEPFEPLDRVACAQSKALLGRNSTDEKEALRLFEESCEGGAGDGCLQVALRAEKVWEKEPNKSLEGMNTLVGRFLKGCRAQAPSVAACARAEALQRSRGGDYVQESYAIRQEACDLDPMLPICPK